MHSHLDFLARLEQDFWNRIFLRFKIQNTHVLCWTCFGQNFSPVHLLLKMDCGIHPPLLVFADERIVNFSELHSKFYCVVVILNIYRQWRLGQKRIYIFIFNANAYNLIIKLVNSKWIKMEQKIDCKIVFP